MTPDEFNARVLVLALVAVMLSVVVTLLAGLFTPAVDNRAIFAIIGPAFNMVIGWAIGRLGKK